MSESGRRGWFEERSKPTMMLASGLTAGSITGLSARLTAGYTADLTAGLTASLTTELTTGLTIVFNRLLDCWSENWFDR